MTLAPAIPRPFPVSPQCPECWFMCEECGPVCLLPLIEAVLDADDEESDEGR